MRRSMLVAAAACAGLALCGCVVAPYAPAGGYGGGGYDDEIAVAEAPPPAPYREVVPVAPFVGAIWISGFWNWSSGRHHWVPGHWERGRPGHRWAPHRWTQRQGHWHLHRGGWVRG